MTWRHFLLHALAFLLAAITSGLLLIGLPALRELLGNPDAFDKRDPAGFILMMGLMMGVYNIMMGGLLSTILGVFIGWRLKLLQPWFAALWGVLTLLAIALLFRNRHDAHLLIGSALSGFFSGLVYWWFAVRGHYHAGRG